MFGVSIDDIKKEKILTEIYKIFSLKNRESLDVRALLNIINEYFVLDFNELKYSVKNDEKIRFKFSDDLCTLNLIKYEQKKN